jgi:hypothetical protein
MNPLQSTVRWLATHTLFPSTRLDARAEAMVCIAAIVAAEDAAALAAYILNGGEIETPFYCLDEGDGKPRCAIQCPYCEKV